MELTTPSLDQVETSLEGVLNCHRLMAYLLWSCELVVPGRMKTNLIHLKSETSQLFYHSNIFKVEQPVHVV